MQRICSSPLNCHPKFLVKTINGGRVCQTQQCLMATPSCVLRARNWNRQAPYFCTISLALQNISKKFSLINYLVTLGYNLYKKGRLYVSDSLIISVEWTPSGSAQGALGSVFRKYPCQCSEESMWCWGIRNVTTATTCEASDSPLILALSHLLKIHKIMRWLFDILKIYYRVFLSFWIYRISLCCTLFYCFLVDQVDKYLWTMRTY